MLVKRAVYNDEWIDNAMDPVLILKDDRFINCNKRAVSIFKFTSKAQCKQICPWQLSPTYQPDGQLSAYKAKEKIKACYQEGVQRFIWLHHDMQNNPLWVEVSLLKVHHNEQTYIHATLREITENPICIQGEQCPISSGNSYHNNIYKTDTTPLNHYQLLLQHKRVIDAASIVSKTDPKGVITYVNDKFCQTSGYSFDELMGQKHSIISHPDVPKALYTVLWKTITSGKIWQGIIKNKKKNGQFYVVNSTIAPIFDNEGEIKEYIAIRNDITDLYEKDRTIAQQCIDDLTQLQNNTKLIQDLKNQPKQHAAIISIHDLLDIQTAYQMVEYHRVIFKIAQKLVELSPKDFTFYRYSESLFAVTLNASFPVNIFVKQCLALQQNFQQVSITTNDNAFSLLMSIGVAQWQENIDVVNLARIALADADEHNQNIAIYDKENTIHQRLMSTISWTNRLKEAMENNDIVIFGQKIVNKHYHHYGTEVLMRYYNKETKQYISPIVFLDFSKKAKFYTKLTQLVATKAFAFFAQTKERFSLNISRADIDDHHTRELLLSLMRQYNLGSHVVIELVESENYDIDNGLISDFLLKIKSFGALVAIDDFGSGYSNFEYLTRLPVDIIKIDGSLIKEIATQKKHQIVVQTIVNFCQALNIKVVAEFIENAEILTKVEQLGVDLFQGYHFNKPKFLSQ